jgi:UDP-N-acetylglucosamine diphosphorylase/glucosamine-1-phosphate N-acetyltransferase
VITLAADIKIYIIDRPFYGQDICLMGRPLREYALYNFPDALLISDANDVCEEGADFLALIYTDTPLCDMRFLAEKRSEITSSPFSMLKIGAGYLKNLRSAGEKEVICNDPKAIRVQCASDISAIYDYLKKQTLYRLSHNNVFIIHPESTHIDTTVSIGEGSIIHPMVCLKGGTRIGSNVEIFPFTELMDTQIGDNSKLYSAFAQSAVVGSACTIGPFTCLRPGAVIGDNCRVGPYVEIKKSTLRDNVKAAHLAYIGDSFVDSGTNIGCGVVFANYDGKNKHKTTVGKNVFIGANCNLVAPLTIGDNAFIAAGSTLTKDLPAKSFCIARSREVIKPDYPVKSRNT